MLDRREKAFAAAALLGLAIGIVALVVAIDAKNGTKSDAEVASQVKAQVAQVRGQITSNTARAENANNAARKGAKSNMGKIARNRSKIARSKAKIAKNNAQLTRKKGRITKNKKTANRTEKQAKRNKERLQSMADRDAALNRQLSQLQSGARTLTEEQTTNAVKVKRLRRQINALKVKKKNRK